MNSTLRIRTLARGLSAGVLLGAAGLAQAQVNVTFQVDMTATVLLGKFNPANLDYVEARGSFQNPSTWSGGFQLTNNPAAANTNIYSGTYPDANSIGTGEQYKFVVDNGSGVLGWEGINNRTFTLGTDGTVTTNNGVINETLAVVYFNNQPPASSTNMVTFQVDMSVEVGQGNFTPGVDTVTCRGAFEGWNQATEVQLTNNPVAANTNLYSGIYPVTDAAGTVEQYKFLVDEGSGVLGWEQPAGTAGGNRSFTLANTNAQILPPVFFNDLSVQEDILSSNTWVTFSVSMTNAVGTDAHVFNPGSDFVYLNGYGAYNSTAVPPVPGTPYSFWTWGVFPPVAAMTNTPPSQVYYTSVLVPAGSPLAVDYKYGINGSDDEAGFGLNHVRYIRQIGVYSMPMDIFGDQLVEPSFGNLAVAGVTNQHAWVTWLGRPGVHLQTATSLQGAWQDHPETDGLSSTNWPVSGATSFFRLYGPKY